MTTLDMLETLLAVSEPGSARFCFESNGGAMVYTALRRAIRTDGRG